MALLERTDLLAPIRDKVEAGERLDFDDGVTLMESDDILAFLFEHQLQQRFRYVHRWTEGDVLFWDDIGTLHNAQADYGPDESRLIKRCQVMADKVFDPGFMRAALTEPVPVS